MNQYGIPHITGSYSLRLMTWRDLDIYLENDDLNEKDFFLLGKEIVSLLKPIKMSFRNERIAKTEGLPVGLYWGIYLGDERNGAWKIDIWGMDKKECLERLEFCNKLANKISPDSRIKILEIKSQCWTDPILSQPFRFSNISLVIAARSYSSFHPQSLLATESSMLCGQLSAIVWR